MLETVGLNLITRADRRANLGYWVKSSETGRGHATAATRLLARAGLAEVGLTRIRLLHAEGNIGSQRVAEKAGFVYEGRLRARLWLHGSPVDARLYSLIDVAELRGDVG